MTRDGDCIERVEEYGRGELPPELRRGAVRDGAV